MSQRWQASATYTLSWFKDAQNQPFSGLVIVPFTVAPDLGNEYTLRRYRSAPPRGAQRHLGSRQGIPGERTALPRRRNPQRDQLRRRRSVTSAPAAARVCDRYGTIVPRNDYIQPAQNKTDLRVQQRIPLGGRLRIDLIGEAFNIFNHENLTIITQLSSSNVGQPSNGQYRAVQLGFRLTYCKRALGSAGRVPFCGPGCADGLTLLAEHP